MPLIVTVDGHRNITQHSLYSCGGDHDLLICIFDLIGEHDQLPKRIVLIIKCEHGFFVQVNIVHLQIANGSL